MPLSLITLWIDIIGAIIGLFSIWFIVQTKAQTGEESARGLNLFIWGVVFMVFAFLDSIVFLRLSLLTIFSKPPLDIHHILMTVGMIFFVFAARDMAQKR